MFDHLADMGVRRPFRVSFEDDRNAADFAEIVMSLPRMTDRQADRILRTTGIRADAPEIVLPARAPWGSGERIVCANELELAVWLRRFGGLREYREASSSERLDGGPLPVNPCDAATCCGPAVDEQVKAAVRRLKATFPRWPEQQQKGACEALTSLLPADPDIRGGDIVAKVCWDIFQLHNQEWISAYRPHCAYPPPCDTAVEVGLQCHYAGSVNYVIFGAMCKLCGKSLLQVQHLIFEYKHDARNHEPSQAWAEAGWKGWPDSAVSTPRGDRREQCKGGCGFGYRGWAYRTKGGQSLRGTEFDINWHWLRPRTGQPPELVLNTF